MKAKSYKFCMGIGPGGMRCPCCAPKNAKKLNNRKFRRTKRAYLQEV